VRVAPRHGSSSGRRARSGEPGDPSPANPPREPDEWAASLDLHATALQCWSSLQANYGVNCCTLMRTICRRGFEHHAAMNASECAGALAEAVHTYLGWNVHVHE
jgi:L-fucose isomerase-like protein